MSDILTIQSNTEVDIVIVTLPTVDNTFLTYTQGGGSIFPVLADDLVKSGGQYYQGNPILTVDTYAFKYCGGTTVSTKPITIDSSSITKGLFSFNTNDSKYYWDETYTTPLGVYQDLNSGSSLSAYKFYVNNNNGNEFYVYINDVNIVPKINDVLVLQNVSSGGSSFTNNSYTNGVNSLPYFVNEECYQFTITAVTIISSSNGNIVYKLTLDKSIKIQTSHYYSLVLLNRKDTSIQKELFYDTFQFGECFREQILGDPYDNTSDDTSPKGRKNYLNYNSSVNLGIVNLLQDVLFNKKTPVIILDIDEAINDKLSKTPNSIEIVLPSLLFQEDERTNTTLPLKLVNSSTVITNTTDIGDYSGLYFSWDTSLKYRIGWMFYDLRIFAIDHSEVCTALSYNSNRNYTLPRASIVPNAGNDQSNPGNGLDIVIETISNGSEVIVQTSTAHGLQDGDSVYISDVYVKDSGNNVISASINGYHFAKLLTPNNPFKFKVYDSSLTVPVAGNGEFFLVPNGDTPKVKGTLPKYSYFFTYRLKGTQYSSTFPYAEITDFNFAKNGKTNNSNVGELLITLPKIKWLKDSSNTVGFSATDLDIIIGEYDNADTSNPQKITGIKNVISFPISGDITYTRNLFDNSGVQTDFSTTNNAIRLTKQDYLDFKNYTDSNVYDKNSNPDGNTTYDIVENYVHYVYNNSDPVPADLLSGNGLWTIGNVKYQSQVDKYRTSVQIIIPAEKWNDTTNPTYDPSNKFISDRFISEIALVLTDADTAIEKPMIYTKISPVIRKTTNLDIVVTLQIDW